MSAVDAARQALDRITAYDAVQPQAWIARFSDEAVLAAAAEVDRRAAAGAVLPLAGLTFAVKDNIDLAGLPTTAACPAFAYSPGTSATVVARLLDAGAVAVGKTNLDQFATGLVGTRSPHGAPACVFNRDYVSGGSSSGSAVAVAAGLVDFALGTDTAGSGRVPAAFNGLVGFKPSRGRWSTQGLVPACRSLDCISVFTADAALARRIDAVAAGFDAGDDFSRPIRDAALPGRPRYGVPRADQLNFLGDSESAALYRSALKRLDGDVVEVDIAPLLEAARLLYAGPYVAERTAAMKDLLARNATAVHPVVRAIVQAGAGLSAVEAYEGQYALAACARAAEAIWSAADVLVLPTTGTIYRIAEVLAEPFALNANLGLYTNFVNLLDLSAVAVPAGFRANGTGFGISLIAPAWTDAALLDLAGAFARTKPSPGRPPLDLGEAERGVKLCVVGAHLHGMPLHWQLTSRNARLVARTRTAPCYRLYAMAGSTPPKPALVHDETGGSLEVEVYELGVEAFGSFTVEVPAP
ncbi:allophanate hydrolase, partial [Phenylobacterium sp.]|uniref:allophanate hydrolase n=1 Tax=Phenylobacterium sp. TaxID=1871053 RepID=UPI002FDDBF1E